jgi:hypothetical protein
LILDIKKSPKKNFRETDKIDLHFLTKLIVLTLFRHRK